MRAALCTDMESATPIEMMQVILKAPAELLYMGGIGTYVKGSAETNADAADKANDTIRVNGAHLRAVVVGEGANLGFTRSEEHTSELQSLMRISYAVFCLNKKNKITYQLHSYVC